jgi:hypothetical protein
MKRRTAHHPDAIAAPPETALQPDPAPAPPSTPPSAPPTDPPEADADALAGLLDALAGADSGVIRVWRIETTGQETYLGSFAPDSFSLETLQQEAGAGRYRLRAAIGSRFASGSRTVSIAAPLRQRQPAPSPAPEAADPIAALAARLERIEAAIRPASPAPSLQPADPDRLTLRDLLPILRPTDGITVKDLLPLLMEKKQAATPVGELVGALRELRDLAPEGSAGAAEADPLAALVPLLAPLLQQAAAAPAPARTQQQQQRPALTGKAAPAPARPPAAWIGNEIHSRPLPAPPAPAPAPPAPAPAADLPAGVAAIVRTIAEAGPMLIRGAQAGGDPGTYAEIIDDALISAEADEAAAELIRDSTPETLAALAAQQTPALAQHADFCAAVARELIARYTGGDDATAAGSPEAQPAPAAAGQEAAK